MIRVLFHTNVDAYKKDCWPKYLQVVPRVGEFINVRHNFKSYFRDQTLPTRMEVVSVTYDESDDKTQTAFVELWYNSTDKQLADMSGGKTL